MQFFKPLITFYYMTPENVFSDWLTSLVTFLAQGYIHHSQKYPLVFMRISMSRVIWKVSEATFLSSKPVPYLPYLDEEQRDQAWFYKIKRTFSVWKKECETTEASFRSSDIWLRMMNMENVMWIGYFVAGYQKNNDVFLHWQHREKCPEDQ